MLSNSKIVPFMSKCRFFSFRPLFIDNSYFDISEEVRNALESKKPVVALESTIVTHGMPYPSNVECGLEVEKVVRDQVNINWVFNYRNKFKNYIKIICYIYSFQSSWKFFAIFFIWFGKKSLNKKIESKSFRPNEFICKAHVELEPIYIFDTV